MLLQLFAQQEELPVRIPEDIFAVGTRHGAVHRQIVRRAEGAILIGDLHPKLLASRREHHGLLGFGIEIAPHLV